MKAQWKQTKLQRLKCPDPAEQTIADIKAELQKMAKRVEDSKAETRSAYSELERVRTQNGRLRILLARVESLRQIGVFTMGENPLFLQGPSFDAYLTQQSNGDLNHYLTTGIYP